VTFTGPGGLNQTVTVNGSGQACFTSTTLTTGTVTATYNGDACHSTSTGTVAVTVNRSPSTTTVTATPNPSACGQSVTVCATVAAGAPGSGTPTGTVTFTGPGGLSQTVPVNGSGQACFTSTSLASGTITATYSGDTCFLGSSGTVVITANSRATTMTATPAQIRLRANGSLVIPAISATLRETGTNAPVVGQTVVFVANSATGPVVLGSAVTDASGVATLAPPNLTVPGTILSARTYRASFAGAACLAPSSATGTLTFVPAPILP
ncbi:Ig-like domain-containing protein, partial [Streptomyces sp. Amel2xB2]|uniref:Ig-like domain-containing protein n=1 Tax=Streptomyces sp. Amel2xB2 TaxID=1305829 RepID=UPI000DBF541B